MNITVHAVAAPRPGVTYLLAIDPWDIPIGVAVVGDFSDCWLWERFWVEPAFRREGVAQQLVDCGLSAFKGKPHHHVNTMSAASRVSAWATGIPPCPLKPEVTLPPETDSVVIPELQEAFEAWQASHA